MKTRANLISRALQRLHVLAVGQDVSAEDAALCDDQVDPLCEELAGRGLVSIADTSEFEDVYFLPLADKLAWTVAADFGVTLEELNRLGIDGSLDGEAEKRIRKIRASAALDEPVQALYY